MTENAHRVSQSIESNPAALLDLTSLNHQPCLHVLHVDDDAFFLDTSKNILEMDGKFEVETAASVDEALSKMKSKQFDAVVSDYEMPLKNGLQFLRVLREQKNDVAFIMFTGRSREEVVVEALNLGADRFISKCGDSETVYFELAHAINTVVERKKAQEKLREVQENFRELAEESPNMIFINIKGKVVYANRKCEETMGYTRDEFYSPGFNFLRLIAEESKVNIKSNFNRHMGGEEVESYEYKLVTKQGKIIDAIITTKLVKFSEQNAILGIVTDITERKKTDEALRQSEVKYKELINAMNDTAWVIDLDANFIDVNDATVRMLGYSREELLSMGPCDIDSSLTKEQIRELVRRMPADHAQVFETTHTTKDGRKIPVEISSSLVTYQGKQVILSIARNMTERKQMETKLREAEKRYRALFNHAPLGVLIVDARTKALVEFNDVAHQQLGYSREEFAKLTVPDIEAIESVRKVNAHVVNMLKEGGSEFETKHRTKNGEIRDVLVTTKVVELEGKTSLHCIFHDITEIRRVQDALMKSESKYRQLVELAHEGVWALDNNFVTVFVNPAMAQMLGYSESEIVGKSLFEFVDRSEIELAKGFLSQFKEDIKGHFEYAFPTKGGTRVYTSIVASNITDDQGGLIGTLALVADITERKQIEEALRESEERLRAIVANSPIGIATSGSDKRFLSANEAFCRILGYTEEELRTLTFKDITHPEDTKESSMKMEELGLGKISWFALEKRYVKKDGSIIFGKIMVSAIRDETGKPNLFIAELQDISERKKKEHELREERNKLEAITQSIGAGFGIMSKDYHVLWVNKFIKQYKGDVEGKLCYATLNDLDHVCPDCGVKKVFENGVSYDAHEYQSVDIKGNPYWVELIATPIKDEAGKVVSAIEIAIDITEKKKLQTKLAEYSTNLEKLVEERTEELKQTQAKLVKSERLAAIGELAAMIGHDLRNPLAGMKNAVYYLNKHFSTGSNDTERKMFQVINDCIDHSNKIIDDLLEYSRNIKLEVGETTPKELLKQSMASIEIPADVQVIDLTVNGPVIAVDVSKMKRVFVNLLKNAFDAMPNGGSMKIVSRTKAMEVEVEFSDTGVGMSQETLNRIWTPLFTTKAKGMGFGLAICKRFVEAHGGRIIVSSEEGEGTTFIIKIPRKLCSTEA